MLRMAEFVILSYKQQSRRDIWCFNTYDDFGMQFPDDKDDKDAVCLYLSVVPELEDPVPDNQDADHDAVVPDAIHDDIFVHNLSIYNYNLVEGC